jgi:hypothetical protein
LIFKQTGVPAVWKPQPERPTVNLRDANGGSSSSVGLRCPASSRDSVLSEMPVVSLSCVNVVPQTRRGAEPEFRAFTGDRPRQLHGLHRRADVETSPTADNYKSFPAM